VLTVIGISDHYGRAELVTIAAANGGAPAILDRRQARLIAASLPGAPYHHQALEIPLADAEELIARVKASVAEHCRAALAELRSAFSADAVVLQRSPYARLPDSLAEILASRPLTNAADGMLYREALADAARDLGMLVDRYPRKSDQAAEAAQALGVARETVDALIARFGSEVGVPWRKDHKDAAASALRFLAERSSLRVDA